MNKKDKHNNYGKLVAAAENGEKEKEGRICGVTTAKEELRSRG